jgi:hypothetical protein
MNRDRRNARRALVALTCWSLLLTGAFVARSEATQIDAPEHTYQQWADTAKVPTPKGRVYVHNARCPAGWVACAIRRRIFAPIANRMRPETSAFLFYHELGHVYDTQMLKPWQRARYMLHTGLTGPWRTSPPSYDSPAEHFARTYEACARGLSPYHGFRYESDAVCDLLRRFR